MTTKEKVLAYLIARKGETVSGQELADKLSISRTSIWKSIKTLQTEGYHIQATTNKGYALTYEPDVLSKSVVHTQLHEKPVFLEVYQQVGSTNDEAKKIVNDRFAGKGILLAEEQTNGRGRLGRQFYSPAGSGLYMSLIYPNNQKANAASVTTVAAVAVCKAIEKLTHKKPAIKWVNDIFLEGRKICGILTEGVINFETGKIDSIIVGIGLNVTEAATVPEDFHSIIGSVYPLEETNTVMRNQFASEIINQLDYMYQNLDQNNYLDDYRERCFVLGQPVTFTERQIMQKGIARSIDDEGGLVVELESGEWKTLRYGEISIQLEGLKK